MDVESKFQRTFGPSGPTSLLTDIYKNSSNTGASNYISWFKYPKGLFTMEYLKDYSAAEIPKLIIKNCE